MKNGKILSQQDVKEIIAEHFNIPIENVINTKYSYIIVEDEVKKNNDS